MTEQREYIGAYVTISFGGDDERHSAYISFGQYEHDDADNDEGLDSFGVPDNRVFYYCPKDELEGMLNTEMWDWKLLSIDEYIYRTTNTEEGQHV